jgi:hypothetical protein
MLLSHPSKIAWFALLGLLTAGGSASAERLRVQATLAELPRAPSCDKRTVRVLCRYRIERRLSGPALKAGDLWVMHRCPEFARGPTKYGRGDAPPLRPGHSHRLELAPWEGTVDAAPDGASGTHYEALRTDLAPPPPRVAVVVTGPAGAKIRFDFDAESVSAGRAADSDVLLNHASVALHQLRFDVRGDEIVVSDLHPGRARLNGGPLRGERAITFQDAISVGPFVLNVALFSASTVESDGDT